MRRKQLDRLIKQWDGGYSSLYIDNHFNNDWDLYKKLISTLDALMYLERRGWKIEYKKGEDKLFNLRPDYTTESMVVKIDSSKVSLDELIEEKVGMSFTQALQDRDWAKLKLVVIRIAEHQYGWRKREDDRIL